MNRNRLWLVLSSLALIFVGAWWSTKQKSVEIEGTPSVGLSASHTLASQTQTATSASKTTPPMPAGATASLAQQEHDRESKVRDLLFLTPISFFGRVVDENGNNIAGADVSLSFDNTLAEKKEKQRLTADDKGLFHASGHGMGIVVMVSKHGYYHLRKSDGVFGYSRAGGQFDPHADSTNPAIFVLKKMDDPVPLVRLERYIKVSKDGEPIEISLSTGNVVPDGQGDMKIEVWIKDNGRGPNSNDHFDWRCRVSIPAGGICQRSGEFDFTAPIDGYTGVDEIDMPVSLGKEWHPQATREYFLHLSGDRYARLKFRMIAEGDRFFAMESYLNVKSGERNLEFDPTSKIRR